MLFAFEKKELDIITSSSRPGRGRKFQKKKELYSKERICLYIECAQGDRPAPCPNHFFAVNELSAAPRWYVTCFDVMKLLAG